MLHSRLARPVLALVFSTLMLLSAFGVDRRIVTAASGPALNVNAAAQQHPINPLIYGMNFAPKALAQDIRLPVRRWGGNSTTRYSWQNDMANHASDYYFENIPEDNPDPSHLPDGSAADRFVEQDRTTGTQTLLTIPLIGWTPAQRRTGHPYDCGFPSSRFPSQQDFDPYDSGCGDGYHTNGAPISGNVPGDTSAAIGPSFVQDWMRHLIGRYGTAAQGGVRFYNLDNEPMLWNSTHRDVHPQPTSYDELRDRTYQYAAAIKAVDPAAQTLGPVLWGWVAYFYSAKDVAQGGNWWENPIDRNTHGGTPFVAWYLQQMHAYEQQHSARILNYLDLHYYPQADSVSLSPAGDTVTQTLRLNTTRSLWDPNYVDESWIKDTGDAAPLNGVGVQGAVQLIPRMRDWVSKNYPGTKLSISEYNWGALDHINGALAQADVLGIFGREGIDLATLWDPPASSDPGAFAFRMYRNYDGAGSTFGDTSVSGASANQGQLAVYTALRSGDGDLTLMVINKTSGDLTSSVTLSGFNPAAAALVYRYSAADLQHIVRQPDQAVGNAGFSATFPAASITLIVVAPADQSQFEEYLPLVRT